MRWAAGLLLLLSAMVFPGLAYVEGLWSSRLRAVDAGLFLHAARIGGSAGWAHIYDPQTQLPGLLFLNPPLTALLAAPLGALGDSAGAVAWILASALAVVATAWLTRPRWSLVVVAGPLLWSLWLGQVTAFTLLALALALRLRDSHPWLAGVALAAAFQLKPNLLLAVPVVLAGARAWPLLRAFFAASAAFGAVYLLVLGPDFPIRYLYLLAPAASTGHSLPLLAAAALGSTSIALLLGHLERESGLALATGVVLSLLLTTSVYQHLQDQSLVVVAVWTAADRVPLLAGWSALSTAVAALPVPAPVALMGARAGLLVSMHRRPSATRTQL